MILRTVMLGGLVAVGSAMPSIVIGQQRAMAPHPLEGIFEYVGTLKGQAILANGRYIFLYGPPDGSAPMTADAGTYQIARDTASGRNTYSTNPKSVGATYRWTAASWSGDTVAYVVLNDSGRVTGQGRAVKRRAR